MTTSIHRSTFADASATSEEQLEVQVTQLWGDNVIAQKHATDGGLSFAVGEGEIEIARWVAGDLRVTPPAGAAVFVDKLMQASEPFVLRAGHSADIAFGDMTFQISVSAREARPRRNVAAAVLEDATLRTIAGSGAFHAALFAAFAFFMPSMSSADEGEVDRQRMLDLKAYIQSAAEREQDQKPAEQTSGSDAPSGGEIGQKAKDEEGKAGGTTQTHEGHWSAKGNEKPENAQLARERALREAADFGMVGLLAAQSSSDQNAPVVPWGNFLAGADRESHSGSLYGSDFGDVFGTGLGLTGAGEGGGGKGQGIGVSDIGGLGGACDADCIARRGDGIGRGHGHPGGTHVVRSPSVRCGEASRCQTTVNGKLDPLIIQRIVRLNEGRMVGCYQDGLRTNPSLEGRVAVKFLIGHDGSVAVAQDTAGSDLPDAGVRSCVVKAFYSLSFPEPAGGTVTVVYPLMLTPGQ